MQALLDWFVSISDTVMFFIDYFVGVIADTFKMVSLLGSAARELPQVLLFLPGPFVAVLGVFLTAAIIYKVLGREG